MFKIFYGNDDFNITKEITKITDSALKSNAEIEIFDSENIQEFSSKLFSISFFTEKRLFIVRHALYAIPEKMIDEIITNFSHVADQTTVIFIENSLGKKSKILDFIKKNGEIKNFESRGAIDSKSYIRERFAEENVDIAPLAVERLASFVGNDMWQLTEEIQKLILYKRGEDIDPCIDSADVDLLVRSNFEANIFDLLDSIATKNQKKSIEMINGFLDSGENAIYILSMIERQFRNIAMARFEAGINEFAFAKKAGVHPFVAKKSLSQSRGYSERDIIEIYKKLAWADLKLKSGGEPSQILTRLVA